MIGNITTEAAAYAIERRPNDLREWRAACFLENIGERNGRRTVYSLGEVGLLAVACFLQRWGMKLGASFSIARAHAERIAAAVSSSAEGEQSLQIRIDSRLWAGYAASSPTGAPLIGESLEDAEAILTVNLNRVVGAALLRLRDYPDHATND